MGSNVTHKLIASHLVSGQMKKGEEIGVRIDQTLTQDATGTLVMLEFEAMNISRVRTEVSAQYVDHNILQTDHKNPDDHLFLASACRKFGVWFSRPGNGVSHPVHMENLGVPGKTLLGSDSHTCSAGSLGMLAFGAGGLEVAMAMAGQPFFVRMPEIMGVRLTGTLPEWVSAKDVILEMLRRHGVSGGRGKIIEYYGPGLECLSAMDRHVIANMGAELGATSSVFPSDSEIRNFLQLHGRGDMFTEITADENTGYDIDEEIDLSSLEPLIALPGSPGNVVPVTEVAGRDIYQSYIGSSSNPGFRDLAIAAYILDEKKVHDRVSLDINPASRQILEHLTSEGYLQKLIHAGARIHQAGCNGCIGMGQAPASGKISLRTVPRNFSGRSGTKNDKVYLCSPETAAASALSGVITDPRTLDIQYPIIKEPTNLTVHSEMLIPPAQEGEEVEIEKGPNIQPLPALTALPERLEGPVLLKVGDDISTDDIMPAGTEVLPFRSNIPEISKFAFQRIDETYSERSKMYRKSGSFIVGGLNYGQGSSREHAALGPRYLGLRAVIAKSFARIHWQNLCNFGILPLTFAHSGDWEKNDQGDILTIEHVRNALSSSHALTVFNKTRNEHFTALHDMSARQIEMVLKGSLINMVH
ncbi:MAG: aconitate hydratase [Nitrospiraceae bacterium]|nr:MAG: aconitate hydratase [Nitrospiraceae bacterium]